MMSNTATHYNSEYVRMTKYFRPNQQEIVKVYVEDWDDQQFWRAYLEHVCPNKNFSIDYYQQKKQVVKGKDFLLKSVREHKIILGPNLILCLDNDFNPWLSNYHHNNLIDANNYIINTYWHSIESFLCHPNNLRNYHLALTRASICEMDYLQEMEQISTKIYPLFVLYLVSQQVVYSPNEPSIYSIDEFTIDLQKVMELWPNVDAYIDERCEQISSQIENEVAGYESDKNDIEQRLKDANYEPKDCYVLIQGHALQHAIVHPLLYSIVNPIHHNKLEECAKDNDIERHAYQNKTYIELQGNDDKTQEYFQQQLEDLIAKNHDVFIDPAYSVIKSKILSALI